MCHEPDSRPPAPPVVGALARSGPLELTAADGAVLAAYEAVPESATRAGVVILPDVRGLHPFYRALAERFAQAGSPSVAIDYFARTAGACPREEAFDWKQHVTQVTGEQVRLDVAAAARHLSAGRGDGAARPGRGPGVTGVVTVGFCFGGGHSWALAASGPDEEPALAGAIGFYGRVSLLEAAADRISRPLLMLIAGADHGTPADQVEGLADRLRAAGKDVESHVFDGAPHSFFDRSFAEHAVAARDAWDRTLDFIDRVG